MEKQPPSRINSKEQALEFEEFSGVSSEGVEWLRPIKTKYGTVSLASDIGMGYEENEDRVFADTSRNLFGVADGIGGYAHGAEAAQIISEEVVQGVRFGVKPEIIQLEASSRMRQNNIFMGGACYLYFQIEKKIANIFWAGDVKLIVFDANGQLTYQTNSSKIADAPRGQSMGNISTDIIDIMNYSTIVAASDGLWDNVDISDVQEMIKDMKSGETDIVTQNLFNLAKKGMEVGFETDYGGLVPSKRKDYGKKDNVSIVVFQKLPSVV